MLSAREPARWLAVLLGLLRRSLRFFDAVNGVERGRVDRLLASGRPANSDCVDFRIFAQAEMKTPLVLRGVATSGDDLLKLLLAFPADADLRAESAAIAGFTSELKINPIAAGFYFVAIKQERTALVCDDDIQHAAILQIGESNGASIVSIFGSDRLRDLDEFSVATVQPKFFLLITGEAAAFHRRPVFRI